MSPVKTRLKIILLSITLLISGIVFIFGMYIWFLNKQERVLTGTARPTFPYSDYSLEELNKLYPQYVNADIPTTQTPEETHKKFIAALKEQNFKEAAQCCFRSGDWEAMEKGMGEIQKKGELEQMIGDLDTNIIIGSGQSLDTESGATYYYYSLRDGKKIGGTIEFIKNNKGVWLIKAL